MKFDVTRYVNEPSTYSKMAANELAFHDALNREICLDGEKKKITYMRLPSVKTNNRHRRRSINVCIEISTDTGKVKATLRNKHKNAKAMVYLEDIQSCFDDIVRFFEACTDHNYLIGQQEE